MIPSNVKYITCLTTTNEVIQVPISDFVSSNIGLVDNIVPVVKDKKLAASGIEVGIGGQIIFKSYNNTDVFSGTPIGLLAYDNAGKLISYPLISASSPQNIQQTTSVAFEVNGTPYVLPIFGEDGLEDSDIKATVSKNYSIGGSSPAMFKWDVRSGSINIEQFTSADAYRINGKKVVGIVEGNVVLGNTINRIVEVFDLEAESAVVSDIEPLSIVASNDTSKLVGLDTAIYPDLIELSYLKDVTGPLQDQINSKEDTIVAGTIQQYLRGDKTWQTLNTDAVSEGTSLYFTDARARASISLTNTGTSGNASYSSVTGILNIPGYTLAGLGGEPAFTKNTAFNKDFGTALGTVAQGNDSRILNGQIAYEWGDHEGLYSLLNHNHAFSSLSDVTISSIGSNQMLRYSLANSKWENWTPDFLTSNQTITLNGVITGSGTTLITTSVADNALSIGKTNGLQDALDLKLEAEVDPIFGAWKDLNTRTARTFFAVGDVTGAASFRSIESGDIPNLDAAKITTGTFADERIASASTWNNSWLKTGNTLDVNVGNFLGSLNDADFAIVRNSQEYLYFDQTYITLNKSTIFNSDTYFYGGLYLEDGFIVGTFGNNNWSLIRNNTNIATIKSTGIDIVGGLNVSGLTASQLVATDASKNLVSLSTATYPSLSEIAFIKGLTSNAQTQLGGKEPTITAGTTAQYWRGDKSWQTLDKAAVGLSNVDNTTDLLKPISTATQTALDLKSNLESPTFTGTVVLPSTTSIGSVSNTEIGYLDGVTSAIQTQITAKFTLPALTSGSVLFSNGTTIAQDNANFFWDDTNDRLGIDTATPATSLDVRGQISANSGTLANPAYSFVGDLNTGIYSPSADALALVTGGTERVRVSSDGSFGIGSTSLTGYSFRNSKNITGAINSYANYSDGVVQSDVTNLAYGYSTALSTQAASFNLLALFHYSAGQGSIGDNSSVNSQYGFYVANTLTGATSNYAFSGNIGASANNWNTFMSGTAQNYFRGNVGIGVGASVPTTELEVRGQVSASIGNASSPAYVFVSDLDTGVFSPTANVLSISTGGIERVRVGAAGSLGLGATVLTGYNIRNSRNITGAVTSYGFNTDAIIQSDVTTEVNVVMSSVGTVASAFTLATLNHFRAMQGTIGATSAVTTQVGYLAGSTLTGATNNYGFRGSIASGANRYNNFHDGTAQNHFRGNVGIGASSTTPSTELEVRGVVSASLGTVSLPAYSFVGDLNTGIYSPSADIISFSTGGTERIRIGAAGAVGIGDSNANAGITLRLGKTITGAVTAYGMYQSGIVQSDVTTLVYGVRNILQTQASAFTLANYYHFAATQGSIGVDSAVTEQNGFIVTSTLTGAGSNYGFRGLIAAGTDRWNLHMGGTAQNHFRGNVGIGSGSTVPATELEVRGVISSSLGSAALPSHTFVGDLNTGWWSPAADTQAWSLGGSESMRLNSTGLGIGVTPSYKLDVSGTGHFTGAVTFDTVPSSLQDASSANHLVRYSQWIASTSIKYLELPVKTVSLTNITLSGTQTVNGVALVASDRILVAGQTTQSENGIYVVAAGAWTRATDSDTDTELRGYIVSVSNGTYAGYKYINTNQSAITVGTTAVTYSEFSNISEIDPVFVAWRDTTRTANTFWAAPNGSNGAATWRTLVAADIPTLNQNTTGSAATLTTSRNIAISGDLTWNVDFNGSANVTAAGTLATVNSNVGTFNNVTVNAKGLVTAASNVSYLTANESISITGDATGSGTTAIGLTLATVNANVGQFTKVTVNAKGLVTAAENLAAADIPSLDAAKITTGTFADGMIASATNWNSAYTFTNGFTTNYPDLVAIEALAGTSGFLKKTAENTWSLDTSTYLTSLPSHTLDSHSNVTITSNSAGEILKWSGSAWINNTLEEAGIQALNAGLTAISGLNGTGLLRKYGSTTWGLDTDIYITEGLFNFKVSGTVNYLPKFNSSNTLSNSVIKENQEMVGPSLVTQSIDFGISANNTFVRIHVNGNISSNFNGIAFGIENYQHKIKSTHQFAGHNSLQIDGSQLTLQTYNINRAVISDSFFDIKNTLRFNGSEGTSGQFAKTLGTSTVWATLTTSDISDLADYTGFDARYYTESESDARFVALAGSYSNPAWITSLDWSKLSGVPSTFTPSAHTLDSHSNVTITSNSSGELLMWNGSAWINRTLSEAGIQPSGAYLTSVNLTSNVTGILPIANGGTGSATQNFVDLTTNQSISGTKTFNSNIVVSGINVGTGGGGDPTNTAVGGGAGSNNSDGLYNSFFGASAGANNTTGNYNVFLGSNAGRYISGGVTASTGANFSILIGANAYPLASSNSNQIVIGYNLVGQGSNTVSIGNNSITANFFNGSLKYGTLLKPNGTAGTNKQVLSTSGTQDYWVNLDGSYISNWASKQDALSGTGFVKISGTTISYDTNTYLTALPSHTLDSHSNVTITSKATDHLLKWNGSAWVNFLPTWTSNTGTVTSVSITTANGISGTVATATTTPAITLSLGAITPTSVNGITLSGSSTPTLSVTGSSSISGTNTGDNAVNSLYSGLVSNATHTGDATGSTALTVVGLRGVSLPVLSAGGGILKYTGTTTNTWVFDTNTYLTALPSHTLDSHSNVTITSNSAGEILKWNGTAWINNTLAEAGIQAAGSYLTANQTITLSGIITGSGTTAITTAIADGTLSIAKTTGLQVALDSKMTTTSYPDLVAIEALAGTSGFLKKTSADTWTLDTNTYLTALPSHTLDSHSNVSITSNTAGELLKWSGTAWINNTLAEAGIQGTITATGILIGSGTSVSAVVGTASQLLRRNSGNTAYEFFTHDFINQAGARTAITLSTNNASGAATYNSTTGALNIPTYTLAGLGGFSNPMTTSGDIMYGISAGVATRLAGNTTTTKKFLSQTGNGTISAAPSWESLVKGDVGLGNVENTALSTWAGTANITTVGTITTGVWGGTTITVSKGGTGLTTLGTANQLLRVNAGVTALEYFTPTWISGNQTITLSGDVTGSGATAITTAIASSVVTGKVLTGYVLGASSTLLPTDSILGAFGKVQGQLNAKQATLSGTGIVKSTAGTISYMTDSSANWNTAYGWGNHTGLYVDLTNTQNSINGNKTFNGTVTASGIGFTKIGNADSRFQFQNTLSGGSYFLALYDLDDDSELMTFYSGGKTACQKLLIGGRLESEVTEVLNVKGNVKYTGTLKPNTDPIVAGKFLKTTSSTENAWANIYTSDITNVAPYKVIGRITNSPGTAQELNGDNIMTIIGNSSIYGALASANVGLTGKVLTMDNAGKPQWMSIDVLPPRIKANSIGIGSQNGLLSYKDNIQVIAEQFKIASPFQSAISNSFGLSLDNTQAIIRSMGASLYISSSNDVYITNLATGTSKYVTVDATGKLGTTSLVSGGGASLSNTRIAIGNSANLLSETSVFNFVNNRTIKVSSVSDSSYMQVGKKTNSDYQIDVSGGKLELTSTIGIYLPNLVVAGDDRMVTIDSTGKLKTQVISVGGNGQIPTLDQVAGQTNGLFNQTLRTELGGYYFTNVEYPELAGLFSSQLTGYKDINLQSYVASTSGVYIVGGGVVSLRTFSGITGRIEIGTSDELVKINDIEMSLRNEDIWGTDGTPWNAGFSATPVQGDRFLMVYNGTKWVANPVRTYVGAGGKTYLTLD